MKIALILKPIILNRHNKYEQSYGLSKFMVHSVERNMVKIIDTPCGKAICRSAIMKKMFHSNLLHWKGFRSNTTTTTTTIMKNKVLEIFFSDSLINGLTFWVFFCSFLSQQAENVATNYFQTCVNFINVLRAPFSNKSLFGSFSLVTFWLWWKYESTFVQKTRTCDVDEIGAWSSNLLEVW